VGAVAAAAAATTAAIATAGAMQGVALGANRSQLSICNAIAASHTQVDAKNVSAALPLQVG
jgi:hypothetical protein